MLLRAAGLLADSTAAVSEAAATAARSLGLPRVGHFYNGVAVGARPETRSGSRSLRLLAVSQLSRWKGIHHVVDAIGHVRTQGTDATLDIVGDALFGDESYGEEVRRRAAGLGLEDVIRWHGRADPTPFYQQADALIHLPEAPDPLPTVLLEAHAWSVPVVASATGGVPEIVVDGETGFLVPSASPATAAAAIRRLADPRALERLRSAARKRAELVFSLDGYVEAFDSWIASLGSRSARGDVAASQDV